MKIISYSDFTARLKEALIASNFNLRSDILEYFNRLAAQLPNGINKDIVEVFIRNSQIASKENRAVCQDTGYVQLFVRLGEGVALDFNIQKAADETVAEVYQSMYLRKSLSHPITRENTGNNTPVFIVIEPAPRDVFEVSVMLKGGGSENLTRTAMLLPTTPKNAVVDWVVQQIAVAGAKGCPPYLVGVGIGGSLEKALSISKRLLLYRLNESEMNQMESDIAFKIKQSANQLAIGFQGLKFGDTVIDVKVKLIPCHIATLPVAVSIGCNAVRQADFSL